MNIKYNRYKRMCSYCGDCDHTDRECPIEKKVAPFIRKGIGRPFEFLNERYFKCPFCNSSLTVIDTNVPSCDIECSNSNCSFFAEVKSKCLSCKYLPEDIEMLHGNYDEYIKKRDKGLNLKWNIYYQKEYSFMDFLIRSMKEANCTNKEIDKIKNYQHSMEKMRTIDINDKENRMN